MTDSKPPKEGKKTIFSSVEACFSPWVRTFSWFTDQKSCTSLIFWCSVQFSGSLVSDSLRPHGLQHARLPCQSPTPKPCPNSCPLSHWCHPTISFSIVSFSSCLQSCPAPRSFPMSQFFISVGQIIRASASASVLPVHIQDWFPLGLTGLILQSKELSRVLQHHSLKASILPCSSFFFFFHLFLLVGG